MSGKGMPITGFTGVNQDQRNEGCSNTKLNGKRPPDRCDSADDYNSSNHHRAVKRPKNNINNGFDYAAGRQADFSPAGLCNGQPSSDAGPDKPNHLSAEQSVSVTRSPSPAARVTHSPNSAARPTQRVKSHLPDAGAPAVANSGEQADARVTENPAGGGGGPGADPEPEVITLSDSEDELREVLMNPGKFKLSNARTLRMLRKHKQKLRLEESKLLLLRRLRDSVESARYHHRTTAADASAKVDGRVSANQISANHKSGGNAPPPLKRGLHSSPGHHSVTSHKVLSHHNVNQQSPVDASHSHSAKQLPSHVVHHTPGGHNSSGAPPPLVNMTKTPPSQSNGSAASYSHSPAPAAKPAAPQLTAEQKLRAARLALKKQLEQSLQQIPAPKPPPPEVNFLPSLASGEFVYLLGMEEVVKHILSAETKDAKYVVSPFTCVQCSTDFTPVWKRDKPGSKNVICERCITGKQKRAMRKEHTAKLKSTFAKALQKEQEIERRINAGSPLSDIPGLSAYTVATVSTPSQHHHQQHHRVQSNSSPAVTTPSMPQLTSKQSSSSSSHHASGASALGGSSGQLTTAQLQQQALIQAQAAEQMRAMLAAQAMALPYQLYGVSNKQAAELHRQYLLDMINPTRSWKT